jgi:hypothetical protein
LQNSIKKLSEENEKLKTQVHDMKITVKENKKVLNDYIINITKKDKLFEKLNLIISELKDKIKILEEKLKKNPSINKINSSEIKEINFININQNNNYSVTSQIIGEETKNINNEKDILKTDPVKTDLNYEWSINDIREKQNLINNEIIDIKNQLDIIKEQNSFKKKINQSLKADIKDSINDNKNEKLKESFNNSYISQEISSLSNSFDDEINKVNNDKMIFNIEKKYCNIDNLTNFITKVDEKNDKLFLVDGNHNIWEIIKRNDLNIEEIKKNMNI